MIEYNTTYIKTIVTTVNNKKVKIRLRKPKKKIL